MENFQDSLKNLPIQFELEGPKEQTNKQNLIYQISKQYINTAHEIVSEIKTEHDLRQYYTLINQAIRCLRYLKDGRFQLSVEQDFQVTTDLAELLIDETYRFDIAEEYLSALKERLRTTTWMNEQMFVEYLLLYKIPAAKNDSVHTKIAERNLTKLINSLDTPLWRVLFQYLLLEIESRNDHKIKDYRAILFIIQKHKDFHYVVMCSLVNYCLNTGSNIPEDIWSAFIQITSENPKLQLWKLILELLVLIYQDINITDKLEEFKLFFENHKSELDKPVMPIKLFDNVSLQLHLPTFNYKDSKNLLLFFQSVSYLPNCYDKRTNFSTRFLPKVTKTTKALAESLKCKCALSKFDSVHRFYNNLLSLVDFYQACESIILYGNASSNHIKFPYKTLVGAWNSQLKGDVDSAASLFEMLATQDHLGIEFKMIALLHLYSINLAAISEKGQDPSIFSQLSDKLNGIMKKLEDLMSISIYGQSDVWRCTTLLLISMGVFEPFNGHPLTQNQDPQILKELEVYFRSNSFVSLESSEEHESKKIKKSLLLHLWLNYVAGSTIVSDLEKKCVISSTCFNLAKQQHLPHLRYILGIWNLINGTIAMKNKEVAITKAKLEQLVKELN